MPKVGQNIYKRNDGRWEGRLKTGNINGRTIYKSVYASSYTEVKEKLYSARISLSRKDSPTDTSQISIKELFNQWLDERKNDLKPSTVIRYENLFRYYIYDFFSRKNISEIKTKDIEDLIGTLAHSGGKQKKGLQASTLQSIISLFSALRKYASRQGYSVFFSTDTVSIKREKKDIRVFSEREEKLLLTYINGNKSLITLGIKICLFTGIRVGELCALKWDDIDIREGTLRISSTMQRIRNSDEGSDAGKSRPKTRIFVGPPKSASSERVIPLPGFLVRELKQSYVPGAYVLTGETDSFIEPRTIQYKFKAILEKCQIPDANFHATRHTFATRCIELGFDVKSLSEILGHSSVTITLNKYVHPTMSHKAANMEKLSKYNLL